MPFAHWMGWSRSRGTGKRGQADGAARHPPPIRRNEPARSCDASSQKGMGDAPSPDPANEPNGALSGSRDEGVAVTFCDGASQLRASPIRPVPAPGASLAAKAKRLIAVSVCGRCRAWCRCWWSRACAGSRSAPRCMARAQCRSGPPRRSASIPSPRPPPAIPMC